MSFAELILTAFIYSSVKNISRRVENIEESLHGKKIQVGVFKNKKGIR